MTDEYPTPKPRPKLEISFDDLEDAPAPAPRPRLREPAATPWPKESAQPAQGLSPAPPPAWHPAPPDYPPSPPHYPPPAAMAGAYSNGNMAFAAMAMNHKSPGVAVLLSLLLTGAGQVYCGRVGRGVAFFFAGLFSAVMILALIGLILLPIVWIWAAIDAGNLANRQNAMLMAALANQS